MQAHSCFQKACMVVGLQHMHKLPASSDTDFAVRPQQLAEAVAADLQQGLIPFYFLGTIGELWPAVSCP
jgi:tyrosine decarboxylase/aromatic-L-amino-acid decarboxylase